jgi:hypothetical protein
MPRPKGQSSNVLRCRHCRDLRQEGERFYDGYCAACRQKRGAAKPRRHRGSGARKSKGRWHRRAGRTGVQCRPVATEE